MLVAADEYEACPFVAEGHAGQQRLVGRVVLISAGTTTPHEQRIRSTARKGSVQPHKEQRCGAPVELRLMGDGSSSVDGCHSFVQIVARVLGTDARFLRISPLLVRC